MADINTQLPWTDDQWNRVRRVVYEEARAARVAGNFLPLYGPLGPDAAYVSQEKLINPHVSGPDGTVPGFTVDDTTTFTLSTLEVRVYLRSAQVDDPELTSALIAFRRAANVLAHLEDEIIFKGQEGRDRGPKNPTPPEPPARVPWKVSGGEETHGLLDESVAAPPETQASTAELRAFGELLVSEVSRAVGKLEKRYHLGPFACVLGHTYFQAVQTPNKSLDLPQDRILPFLGGGPLVRSSAVPIEQGLLIALGGAPIDLVVATDISVEFLQVTADAWFVFRIYEKIALRISQRDAIERISVSGARRKK